LVAALAPRGGHALRILNSKLFMNEPCDGHYHLIACLFEGASVCEKCMAVCVPFGNHANMSFIFMH